MVYTDRLLGILMLGIVGLLVYLATKQIKRGRHIKIREIGGLQALEEAVGRATELGRPVHYNTGSGELDTINAPQSLASADILAHVARLCGKYDCELIVTVRNPVFYSVAEEVVRQAYLEMGRPEKYTPEAVRFLSNQQFAAAAQAMGIIQREQAAANILIGAFYAESLLLAEAGVTTNAIQVAGTTRLYQIAFFIACCDYTLLGDEMFAGKAYLTQDPIGLGSLLSQDIVKIAAIITILLGSAARTFGNDAILKFLTKWGN